MSSGRLTFAMGRFLMLLGLVVFGAGFVYAMRIEAQEPETNPLGVELAAAAVGFMLFTIGRWCAATAKGTKDGG